MTLLGSFKTRIHLAIEKDGFVIPGPTKVSFRLVVIFIIFDGGGGSAGVIFRFFSLSRNDV